MPPLKSVERLEKLCTVSLANHLFSVFASWYTAENKAPIDDGSDDFESSVESKENECMDYSDEGTTNTEPQLYDSWYLDHLNHGTDLEDSASGVLTPVPEQYLSVSAITQWLAKEVRSFLSFYLAPKFFEDVLATVINVVSFKTEIPRPKDKLRFYEEDLEFIRRLGFLMKVTLQCLLMKSVFVLDLSHVSHLIKRWKVLLRDSKIIERQSGGTERESPYFDVFSYAIDASVIGLRTLKSLKLPHYVHNSFVRKIAYLCPNLETLILRCSADCANPKHNAPVVTNVDILYGDSLLSPNGEVRVIPGCKDLVSLALPEGVETLDPVSSDAMEMLTYMPNLQHLVGAPMIYVTEEFEEIFETLPGPQKLTNFHHGVYDKNKWPSFVYEDTLQEPNSDYLSRVFSQVTEVGIYAPTEVTEKVLKSFSKAHSVTIFTDDFEVHGKYLKNLTTLDINVGYQEEWPIILALSDTCTNLEQLTLRSFSLQTNGSAEPMPRFPSLHTLKFQGQNVLQGDALYSVLYGCPHLTSFVLSMITDEHGDSQLDDNILIRAAPMMANLQKFVYKVQSALRTVDGIPSSVTIKSCDALLNSCPQLTYLGHLDTWKVTKAELMMLHEKMRKKNWDLEIV